MLVLIFYIVKYGYYIVDFSIFILTNCTKSNTMIIGRGIIVHIKWAYDNGAIYFAPSISINLGRAENELLSFTKDQDLLLFDKLRKQVCETYPSFIQNTEDPIYLDSIRRNNCGAIRSEISIDVEGNIRFCNMSAGQNMRLDIGNVLQNSFKSVVTFE